MSAKRADRDSKDIDETSVHFLPFFLPTFLDKVIKCITRIWTCLTFGARKKALAELDKLVEINPQGAIYIFRGLILIREDQIDEAEQSFRYAAMIPSLIDVKREALYHAMRIQSYLGGLDDSPSAREMRARSLENCRQLTDLERLPISQTKDAAEIAMRFKDFDLCRSIIAKWQQQHPEDIEARRYRMRAEYYSGSYGIALIAADELLSRAPGDTEAQEYRNKSLKLIGKIGPPDDAVDIEDYVASRPQE